MIKNATSAAAPARTAARPRPRRATQRRSWKQRIKTFFAVLLLLVETAIAVVLVCALVVFWNFSAEIPTFESLLVENREPVATKIWSEDGVLLGKLESENRKPITMDELHNSRVIDATIAIEDHRFYEHPGVDVVGIGRAVLANLRGSSATKQGASTLTQQLVRQPGIGAQFGLNNEKRFSRKIREALVALRVEQLYTKNEILLLYLNNVYYGGGAYGVEAAAQTYFHKSAAKLTLSQAALIAGLPQSPSELSPFHHKKAAVHRRDEVLDAMLEYGRITRPEYEKAKSEQIALAPPPKHNNFDFKAPYFTTYVLHELTKNYAADYVYSGLSVRTTLNYKMQKEAEHALLNGLANASGFGTNQGALVCLDPQSGYIRAMVGGRDFHASQFNAVTQGRRQPGSTFKVFDYTAAFEEGEASLNDSFIDKPIPYPNDPKHLVKNYGGGYSYAPISCKTAIEFSKNTIAVQVAQKVGIKKVIEYAYKMGIKTPLAPYLPTALGASAVHPIDLCSAYSIFPAKGNRYHPMAILKVFDADGNQLDPGRYAPQREVGVLKDETVRQIDEALEGVVTEGTGLLARGNESNGIVEGAHGKTGTTTDNRDAWFAGYTRELTTVVWVASVHKKGKRLVYAEMPGLTGGHQCAPIWHDFMIHAVPIQQRYNQTVLNIPPPAVKTVAADPTPAQRPKKKKPAALKPGVQANATATVSNPVPDPNDTSAPDAADTTPDTGDSQNNGETTPIASPPSAAIPHVTPNPGRTVAPIPSRPIMAPPSQNLPGAALPTESGNERRVGTTVVPHPAAVSPGKMRNTAPPPRPAAPQMVTVTVCGDTGDLANPYCDTYKTLRVTASQAARMHKCRLHRPPPGEGGQ